MQEPEFRTDATVYVDTNLTREEIYELVKKRPFHKFISFPINIKAAVDAITKSEEE